MGRFKRNLVHKTFGENWNAKYRIIIITCGGDYY